MQAQTYVAATDGLKYIEELAFKIRVMKKTQYLTAPAMMSAVMEIREACDTILDVIQYDDGRQLKLPSA